MGILSKLIPYDLDLIKEFERHETLRPLDTAYCVILTIFISSLVICQIVSFKLWTLGGWLVLPAGTFSYAITFLCTDVISEVYGRRAAGIAVLCGLVANLVLVVSIYLYWLLPPLSPEYQEMYRPLMFTPRIVVASIVAYIVAQSHDVIAFHYWKARTRGRYLWLRNNASTMVSQLIDTCIFTVLAFYGVVDTATLLNMIGSAYLFKWICAVCDTPFCYIGVKLLRKPSIEKAVSLGVMSAGKADR